MASLYSYKLFIKDFLEKYGYKMISRKKHFTTTTTSFLKEEMQNDLDESIRF
jgi:hypothetical protein